jgi:hypothetical protein
VVIDIVGCFCKLVKPDALNFTELLGVPLSPGQLVVKLMRKGVYLLPTQSDLVSVEGVKPKVSQIVVSDYF